MNLGIWEKVYLFLQDRYNARLLSQRMIFIESFMRIRPMEHLSL